MGALGPSGGVGSGEGMGDAGSGLEGTVGVVVDVVLVVVVGRSHCHHHALPRMQE
jgi:hypothetical protein